MSFIKKYFCFNEGKAGKLAFFTVFILAAIVQLLIPFVNYINFRTAAFDYGVYSFAFSDYAHFRSSAVPIYYFDYPITFLQDHFSLTLIFLSPLFWIFKYLSGAFTLMMFQWGFIMWSAYCTWKLIKFKSGNTSLATLGLLYFFLLYGRYPLWTMDCNLAVIGASLIPVFLYYFEREKWILASVIFLVTCLNREDFPFLLSFISVMLMIIHRKEKQKKIMAFTYGIFSIVLFAVIIKYIIPSLEDEHKKFTLFNYGALGKTAGESFAFVLSHPWESIKLLFVNHTADPANDYVKTEFYLVYFVSGGLLLFYRPVFLLALIPLVAKKMYNDWAFRWGIEGYYTVEVATILPILVFYILGDLKQSRAKIVLAVITCVGALSVSIFEWPRHQNIKFNFLSGDFYKSEYRRAKANNAIAAIPANAKVSATTRLIPRLSFREKIYCFPGIHDADYVCAFKHNDDYPAGQATIDATFKKLREDPNWSVQSENTDIIVFSRVKK